MLVINHMMLLLMTTTTAISILCVNTIVGNVDNDDENNWETYEGVAERHNKTVLCLT